jgi:hypothetical protein
MTCAEWSENLKGREHLEDLGVDRRIILKCIVWEGVDWIRLAQNRDESIKSIS